MKKVKIIVKEHKIEEVEYICEVEDKDFEENSKYGISDIDSLGDMSASGGDASGISCTDISRKVLDSDDFDSDIISLKVTLLLVNVFLALNLLVSIKLDNICGIK